MLEIVISGAMRFSPILNAYLYISTPDSLHFPSKLQISQLTWPRPTPADDIPTAVVALGDDGVVF